ncbi:MAG: hypothetical protein ACE5JQ_00660 [Candidatus Methylomirabilales bacterium]
MTQSMDLKTFARRRKPRGLQEITPYEETLKDFVRESAGSLGKALSDALDSLQQAGLIYPLELAYLRRQIDGGWFGR